MRIILVMVFSAFCMLGSASFATAGSYQSAGVYVGSPSPAVTRIFAAFPAGGDGLVAAIRTLLIANPELADDVAYVASRSSAAQKEAAAAGMAEAFIALANQGNTTGAGLIVSAASLSGDPVLQLALSSAVALTTGFTAFPGGNPAAANCSVSRSTPTQCLQ
jgi:hypothetical protein